MNPHHLPSRISLIQEQGPLHLIVRFCPSFESHPLSHPPASLILHHTELSVVPLTPLAFSHLRTFAYASPLPLLEVLSLAQLPAPQKPSVIFSPYTIFSYYLLHSSRWAWDLVSLPWPLYVDVSITKWQDPIVSFAAQQLAKDLAGIQKMFSKWLNS